MRTPRLFKKLLFVGGIFLALWAVSEIVARLVLGAGYPLSFSDPHAEDAVSRDVSAQIVQRDPDASVCFELKPSTRTEVYGQTYTVNSLGLRGEEVQAKKAAGTFRVAVAGDSFAFGWGSGDGQTIPACMERILRDGGEGHGRYEVLNCGVPAYHLGQIKERLERKIYGLDPDLVVVTINVNDVIKAPLHFNTLHKCLYSDFLPLPYSWKPVLWRVSVAYRFAVQCAKRLAEITHWVGGYKDYEKAYFREQALAITKEAKKRGVPLLFVILPWPENFDHYVFEEHHKILHDLLQGVDYVDLLPQVRKYDAMDFWFRVEDHHWNAKGNLTLARLILKELAGRGLVKLKEGALPAEPFGEPLYKAGDYIILDMDADPKGRGNLSGAIFRHRPGGAAGNLDLVCAESALTEPLDCLFDENGNLLVVDGTADPLKNGAHGAVFRVNRYSGRMEVEIASDRFRFPNGIELLPPNRLFISDKEADPERLGTKTGALWCFDLNTQKLDLVVAGEEFISPSPLAVAPGGKLYWIDADANPNHFEGTPGVLFEVDPDRKTSRHVMDFKTLVSPVGIVPLPDGRLVVIDANSDPLKTGYYLGGLHLVDPAAGTCEVLCGSKYLMDPTRGDLDRNGVLVFADPNSDPNRYGPDGAHKGIEGQGRGAIWRFDLKTRNLSLVVADRMFVNPVCVKVVPDRVK